MGNQPGSKTNKNNTSLSIYFFIAELFYLKNVFKNPALNCVKLQPLKPSK